jgi:hypothetical protein
VNAPEAAPIAERLAQWAAQEGQPIAWPEMPDGIEDRNADVWESLLALADLAGGDWPRLARTAALTLVTEVTDQQQSLGIQLLSDLKAVFGDKPAMSTEAILHELNEMDEAPWGDLRGKQLDARGLSRRLRKYGLGPRTVRLDDGNTLKGYHRDELADLWSRYLAPAPDRGVTSVTTSQPTPPIRDAVTLVTDKSDGEDEWVLFPDTNICHECGDPLDQPGLISRCRKRHELAS